MALPPRVIYLECTSTYRFDLGTGIPRVVRNVIRHFHRLAPARGFTVVPVYFERGEFHAAPISPDGQLVSQAKGGEGESPRSRARRYLDRVSTRLPVGPIRDFVDAPAGSPGLASLMRGMVSPVGRLRMKFGRPPMGDAVHIGPNDVLFHIDLTSGIDMRAKLDALRAQHTFIGAIVNDLIPLHIPAIWPPKFVDAFRQWLQCMVACSNCIFTVSRVMQQEIERYRSELPAGSFPASQTVEWFHLGHDMDMLNQAGIARPSLVELFDTAVPVLLNVGWLDPRKNQLRLIDAVAELRRRGVVAKLLLVGKRGLGSDAVYAKIAATPQLAGDVHVFHDVSDAELQYAFTRARALVYPSVAEGFGLPLVEALTHHLPVFASDIPVFREIAGGHAVYFNPLDVTSIADVLEAFLVRGEYAPSRSLERFAWISWEQSVTRLFDLLQQAVAQHSVVGKQAVVQQSVGKQARA